jgi:hypothetical protein
MAIWRRALLIALVALSPVGVGTARAQSAPPPAAAPPPPSAPAAPPPAADPAAPPPAAAPAPPAEASPVAPLSPTLAPEPAPGPPLALEQRTPYTQQQPLDRPFYKRAWFWVGLGVVATVVVLVLLLPGADAGGPPSTTYGNMNAF